MPITSPNTKPIITAKTVQREFDNATKLNQHFEDGGDYREIQNQHFLQRIGNWFCELVSSTFSAVELIVTHKFSEIAN